MKLFAAAILSISLASIPAQAQIPAPASGLNGAQFYKKCTYPPADRKADAMAMCAAYVTGIADDLTYARLTCMGPNMTAERLLPIALGWIRSRSWNEGYPAAMQIRTGFVTLFPCRRNNPFAVRRRIDSQQVIDKTKAVVDLMKDALPLLAYLHL